MKLLISLLLALATATAQAGGYPSRPVRMIVPYAPGGTPDILARVLTQRLSDVFGKPFIVENRPGAGGISAAQEVAKAPADGHVLFLSDIQQLAINPHLFSKLPYNPASDFTPVTLAATIPLYVVAQSDLNINSLADLEKYAKANPGKLTYGSSGIGSIHHITMESLKVALGLDIVHVPYKGAGQSVPAFFAGETSLLVTALPALTPYLKSGKVKLIAVTTRQRSALTPEVPAVAETIPGFDFGSEMGVVVPAGTPPETVKRLSTEIARALQQPEIKQRLDQIGAVSIGSTPEGYGENIRRNLDKFGKAVKISSAKTE